MAGGEVEYITYEDEWYEGYQIYELHDGQGRITLSGNHYESGLLFDGKPVGFTWADCQGSVGQYLVRSMDYDQYHESLNAIRRYVGDEIDATIPVSEALRALLGLFPSGQMLLGTRELHSYVYYDQAGNRENPVNIYPDEWNLVSTRPEKLLNKKQIREFIAKIKKGQRPKIIIASAYGNSVQYILDGHHKLQAYRKLGIDPVVIDIVLVGTPEYRLEDGLQFIKNKNFQKQYTEVKSENFDRDGSEIKRFCTGEPKKFFDAIFRDDLTTVSTMLQANSALVETDNEEGLLLPGHMAASLGRNKIIALLLDSGLDINKQDEKNNTMLHYAALRQQYDTMIMLHEQGADLDRKNKQAETPLDMAMMFGFFEGARKLLSLGADPKKCGRDLIMEASSRYDGAEMVQTLIEHDIVPTPYHQNAILNPKVRILIDEYLLSVHGEGGNIVYEKQSKPQGLKDTFPSLAIREFFHMQIRKIIEWENDTGNMAEVRAADSEGYALGFVATDYHRNHLRYKKGGAQEIGLSAYAKNVKIPMELEADYIAIFGNVEESDFHLWSHYEEEKYRASIMGKILSMKQDTIDGEKGICMRIKTRILEEDNFRVIEVMASESIIETLKLKEGDIVEADVVLMGRLKDE